MNLLIGSNSCAVDLLFTGGHIGPCRMIADSEDLPLLACWGPASSLEDTGDLCDWPTPRASPEALETAGNLLIIEC